MSEEHLTEKRVREIVMMEVMRQIQPIHDWMLAFWSNGSNRPPGYFQTRVQADDERYNRLIESIKSSQRFWRGMLLKVAVPLLLGLLSGLGWGIKTVAPTVRILFEEYVRAHPAVEHRIKNEGQVAYPVLSSAQEQHSAIPPLTR